MTGVPEGLHPPGGAGVHPAAQTHDSDGPGIIEERYSRFPSRSPDLLSAPRPWRSAATSTGPRIRCPRQDAAYILVRRYRSSRPSPRSENRIRGFREHPLPDFRFVGISRSMVGNLEDAGATLRSSGTVRNRSPAVSLEVGTGQHFRLAGSNLKHDRNRVRSRPRHPPLRLRLRRDQPTVRPEKVAEARVVGRQRPYFRSIQSEDSPVGQRRLRHPLVVLQTGEDGVDFSCTGTDPPGFVPFEGRDGHQEFLLEERAGAEEDRSTAGFHDLRQTTYVVVVPVRRYDHYDLARSIDAKSAQVGQRTGFTVAVATGIHDDPRTAAEMQDNAFAIARPDDSYLDFIRGRPGPRRTVAGGSACRRGRSPRAPTAGRRPSAARYRPGRRRRATASRRGRRSARTGPGPRRATRSRSEDSVEPPPKAAPPDPAAPPAEGSGTPPAGSPRAALTGARDRRGGGGGTTTTTASPPGRGR